LPAARLAAPIPPERIKKDFLALALRLVRAVYPPALTKIPRHLPDEFELLRCEWLPAEKQAFP
jgi:hypothetical protein